MVRGVPQTLQWDCTAHIMPYLQVLHTWLRKVGAEMPSVTATPELAAPVEVRIDHGLLRQNEDHHRKNMAHQKPETRNVQEARIQTIASTPETKNRHPTGKASGSQEHCTRWGEQGFSLNVTSAEETLRSAFLRRDLLECPVSKKPRRGTNCLIRNKEFLGTHKLSKVLDPEQFMSAAALGLVTAAESWWVASHGRWCPGYHYYYYYYYY